MQLPTNGRATCRIGMKGWVVFEYQYKEKKQWAASERERTSWRHLHQGLPLTVRSDWTCTGWRTMNAPHTHPEQYTTTTPQPFYGPFSGTIQVSRCQKKASSGLYGAREDNKRQTHRQSGWVPLHPDQSAIHVHQSPIFTSDDLPAATLTILACMLDCIPLWLG